MCSKFTEELEFSESDSEGWYSSEDESDSEFEQELLERASKITQVMKLNKYCSEL